MSREKEQREKKYTLSEIKDTYFPNRDISSLKPHYNNCLDTRNAFFDVIRKTTHSEVKQKTQKK